MVRSDVNPSDFLIHVVDDFKPNVVLLSHILEAEGFKVIKSYDGEEALDKTKEMNPDLILLDIMLPTMSGIEVATELNKTEFNGVPIIFISSTNESVDKVKAFEVGGVDFVKKPFDKDELIVRIRNHLMLKELKLESERYLNELKERESELSKAYSDKNEILRMLSHDIKNPLSGIMGLINILTSDESLEEDEKTEMLELVKESSEKLLGVVKNLLDKELDNEELGGISIQENNFLEVAKQVLIANSPKATLKKIKLQFISSEDMIPLHFDRLKIYQALNILVSNAIKFTLSGGVVSLKVEDTNDDFISIVITDTGIGIPNKLLPKFLISSDRNTEADTDQILGADLGLDEVLATVKAHDGKIWVNSEENVGTSFFIEIPK